MDNVNKSSNNSDSSPSADEGSNKSATGFDASIYAIAVSSIKNLESIVEGNTFSNTATDYNPEKSRIIINLSTTRPGGNDQLYPNGMFTDIWVEDCCLEREGNGTQVLYAKDYYDENSSFYELIPESMVVAYISGNDLFGVNKVLYKDYVYDDRYEPSADWELAFREFLRNGKSSNNLRNQLSELGIDFRSEIDKVPVFITESWEFDSGGVHYSLVRGTNIIRDPYLDEYIPGYSFFKDLDGNEYIGIIHDSIMLFIDNKPIGVKMGGSVVLRRDITDKTWQNFIMLDEEGRKILLSYLPATGYYQLMYEKNSLESFIFLDVDGDGKVEQITNSPGPGGLYSSLYYRHFSPDGYTDLWYIYTDIYEGSAINQEMKNKGVRTMNTLGQ